LIAIKIILQNLAILIQLFISYLVQLPYDLRKAYCNYRCLNHRLPIEKGRFWGVKRDDRICDLCDLEHIGDEFHYLFECKYFERERKQLATTYKQYMLLAEGKVILQSCKFLVDCY
jgi:hypothetical protein